MPVNSLSEDKFTKQDIANYYEEIQEWILPFVTNRPLTVVRCPEGYKNILSNI